MYALVETGYGFDPIVTVFDSREAAQASMLESYAEDASNNSDYLLAQDCYIDDNYAYLEMRDTCYMYNIVEVRR